MTATRTTVGGRRLYSIDGDCIVWQGRIESGGYGRVGRRGLAHRQAWERANGPIPDGLLVLHHCDNPPCVNPEHLFLGTHQDNSDDAKAKGRVFNGRQSWTHCVNGHEFTPENTYRTKRGVRRCRQCARDLDARRRAENPRRADQWKAAHPDRTAVYNANRRRKRQQAKATQ